MNQKKNLRSPERKEDPSEREEIEGMLEYRPSKMRAASVCVSEREDIKK